MGCVLALLQKAWWLRLRTRVFGRRLVQCVLEGHSHGVGVSGNCRVVLHSCSFIDNRSAAFQRTHAHTLPKFLSRWIYSLSSLFAKMPTSRWRRKGAVHVAGGTELRLELFDSDVQGGPVWATGAGPESATPGSIVERGTRLL
jgi:hypothetical protein